MRKYLRWFALACSPLILVVSQAAQAFPLLAPQSVGAVGDSITAGSLAKYSRDSAESWKAFVQDSNAGKPIHFPDLSWSTGTDPRSGSFVLHLIDFFHVLTPPSGNFAVPGAVLEDVRSAQIGNLSAWSQKTLGQKFPDVVTVFIGGNDICRETLEKMTSPKDYEAGLRNVLETILAESPASRVMVVPIPKSFNSSQRLYANLPIIGSGATSPNGKDATCQDFWDLYEKVMTGCPTVLHRGRPDAWIQAVDAQIQAYNGIMLKLAQEYAVTFKNFKGESRITYSRSMEDMTIQADQLSVDCFHPNPKGQAKVGELVWSDFK